MIGACVMSGHKADLQARVIENYPEVQLSTVLHIRQYRQTFVEIFEVQIFFAMAFKPCIFVYSFLKAVTSLTF